MIVIVDYGFGNLGSVLNMLKKFGAKAVISEDPSMIGKATKIILPGVGSFDNGMRNLEARGLVEVLNHKVLVRRTPILGICLGVQLFTRCSEEGSIPGLGWLDAETIRFKNNYGKGKLRIPHMGWNVIQPKQTHPLLKGFDGQQRFYFVHSYHLSCQNPKDVIATCFYGIEFAAGVAHENIMGTQFHPEKSHKFGLKLLNNFIEIT